MNKLSMNEAEELILIICGEDLSLERNPKALDWAYTLISVLNDRLKVLEDA